jgi:hypothetical protein
LNILKVCFDQSFFKTSLFFCSFIKVISINLINLYFKATACKFETESFTDESDYRKGEFNSVDGGKVDNFDLYKNTNIQSDGERFKITVRDGELNDDKINKDYSFQNGLTPLPDEEPVTISPLPLAKDQPPSPEPMFTLPENDNEKEDKHFKDSEKGKVQITY